MVERKPDNIVSKGAMKLQSVACIYLCIMKRLEYACKSIVLR